MKLGTRVYWVLALVAVIALAGAAVTLSSGLTSAGDSDPTPAVQSCDQQDEGHDGTEVEAFAAAQSAAPGDVGEIDLEDVDGRLVFNVDVGGQDVKVDAGDGSIV